MITSQPHLLLLLFLIGLTACKEGGDNSPSDLPEVSFSTVTAVEGSSGTSTISFPINLSKDSGTMVSLSLSTEDGSAKAGLDYEAVNDKTITFNPGETNKTFDVTLIADEHLELTEQFEIKVSNLQGATASSNIFGGIITDDDTYEPDQVTDGFITPASYPSMLLLWADEFDGAVLNTQDWNYEIGNGCDQGICGWGNNELEEYTDSEDNVFIRDDKLVIKATEENGSYNSGRLTTQNKQLFRYGRIDIRAKLPKGQGIWPALWMLGANITEVGWPQCGEIDIMEAVGHEPDFVHGTTHYDAGGYQSKGASTSAGLNQSFNDEFHIYTIIWQENKIEWLVDYNQFFSFTSAQANGGYPFNNDFFMLFNVAVGGNWPGNPDATTVFPQEMVVDYVRVFQ